MSRWKAFAIHFSISVFLLLILLAVIVYIWFPGVLFSVDGGWAGLQIVMGVDLVLGPLLTLIVFKHDKPGLKFDLGCIATLQGLCMAAGMWVVYEERPLALVLAWDSFYSVDRDEFVEYGKDVALLDDFPGPYPKLIYTEMPENPVSASMLAVRSQFIGDPLYIQSDLYRPIPIAGLRDGSVEVESIFRQEEESRSTTTESVLQASQGQDCVLTKLVSAQVSGYACFDIQRGQLTKYIPFEVETPAE